MFRKSLFRLVLGWTLVGQTSFWLQFFKQPKNAEQNFKLLNERMNEWTNQQRGEWTNGRMNEWSYARTNE